MVCALPGYDPWSPELPEFDRLVEAEDWPAIQRLAVRVMENWLLTPYVHEALALAHRRLGDEERAALEVELFEACAEGILSTGDGSPARPYRTVRVDDAYGALASRELAWTGERDERRDGRACRVLRGEDGREHWFDISRAAAVARGPKRS